MGQGYFFVGDLLGFSKIIENTNSDALTNRIDQWLNLVKSAAKECGIQKFQLISDTVFAAGDSSTKTLNQLIKFGQCLLNSGVPKSLPIRGAITHGEYRWDNNFTYGKAVIDAHELEKTQNWVGIACSQMLPHLKQQWPETLVCYPVPKKNGIATLQPTVMWNIPNTNELHKFLCDGNLTKNGDLLDWKHLDRIIHTINFRNYIHLMKLNGNANHTFSGLSPNHTIDTYISSLIK